jgi:serine/threonine-protein kinase
MIAAACLHCGATHAPDAVRCPTTGRALGGDPRLIGQTIDRRYRIIRLLGGGPFGSVYKAEHVALGRAVALRVLPADLARSGATLERFLEQARRMGSVANARLQPLSDAGLSAEGVAYVAYAYVRGRSLASALFKDAPLAVGQAATNACDELEGLSAVHESGFVHRALGPESVLLQPSESGLERATLTNFGATALDAPDMWHDSVRRVAISRMYQPPEREREAADVREDVFSVGVMLAAMASPGGRPRFGSDLLSSGVPAPIEAAVAKATHRERSARFASAREMRAVLLPLASFDVSDPAATTDTHISDLRALAHRERQRSKQRALEPPSDVETSPLVEPAIGRAVLGALARCAGPSWEAVSRSVYLARIFLDPSTPKGTPVPLAVLTAALEAADRACGTGDRLFCCLVGEKAVDTTLVQRVLGEDRVTPELLVDSHAARVLMDLTGGDARVTHVGRGYGRVELRGQPRPSLPVCACAAGMLSGLLARAGARDVELSKTACEAVGDVACIYTATWM